MTTPGHGRKAYCAGTRAKPAIVVAADLSVWLGNETNEEISLTACELCGFNLGSFEEKVVAGPFSDQGRWLFFNFELYMFSFGVPL